MVLKMALPELDGMVKAVQDAAHASAEFLEKWKRELLRPAEKEWKRSRKEIDDFENKVVGPSKGALQDESKKLLDVMRKSQEAVDEAHTKYRDKAVAAVGGTAKQMEDANTAKMAYLDAIKKMKEEVKTQAAARDRAEKELGEQQKALGKLRDQIQRANQEMPGSGALVGAMLDDFAGIVTKRLDGFLRSLVGNLVSKGIDIIREVLDPVVESVIGAIGSIPFVGGALAVVGQIAYKLLVSAMKSAITDALVGVVERFLAKVVRQVVSPLFNQVKDKLRDLVLAACGKFKGVCPDEGGLKFGVLPAKDRWLDRVLACRPGPIIDEETHRQAGLARAQLERLGREMRANAGAYARGFADRALARHGLSYRGWMALARRGAADAVVKTKVAEIRWGLGALPLRALGPSRAVKQEP